MRKRGILTYSFFFPPPGVGTNLKDFLGAKSLIKESSKLIKINLVRDGKLHLSFCYFVQGYQFVQWPLLKFCAL